VTSVKRTTEISGETVVCTILLTFAFVAVLFSRDSLPLRTYFFVHFYIIIIFFFSLTSGFPNLWCSRGIEHPQVL